MAIVAPAARPDTEQNVEALIEEARRHRRRRYFRSLSAVLVLLLGVVIAFQVTGGGSGHRTTPSQVNHSRPARAVTKHSPRSTPVEHAPAPLSSGLSAVSCPGSRCVAVGYSHDPQSGQPYASPSEGAAFVSGDAGTTWSTAAIPDGVASLGGVDCSSPSTCVAAGQAVSPETGPSGVLIRSTNAGETWTRSDLPPDTVSLSSVSCSSALTCVAVGPPTGVVQNVVVHASNNGHPSAWPSGETVGVISRDGGRSWEALSLPISKTGYFKVSCDASGTCMALSESVGAAPPTIATSTDFGQRWTSVPVPSAPYSDVSGFIAGGLSSSAPLWMNPSSVDCVTNDQCLLSGEISDFNHLGLVEITDDAGRHWQMVNGWSPSTTAGYGWPGPVSCVGTRCMALGEQLGLVGAFIGVSENGGASWTILATPQFTGSGENSAFPPGLACVSPSSCVVVGAQLSGSFFAASSAGSLSEWTDDSLP
jgi:photosystem II stability/assembly factor-like uncharacterized protein